MSKCKQVFLLRQISSHDTNMVNTNGYIAFLQQFSEVTIREIGRPDQTEVGLNQ